MYLQLGFLFGAPRTATVRAATHCKLIMLNRRDVDKILHHFPLIEKYDVIDCNVVIL